MPHIDKRLIIIVAVLFFVFVIAGVFAVIYIQLQLVQIPIGIVHQTIVKSQIEARIAHSDLLYYNNSRSMEQYVLVGYGAANTLRIGVNVTIFNRAPPTNIYIFNYSSSWCVKCGDAQQVVNKLVSDLQQYNLISGPNQITLVTSKSALLAIKRNALVIVLNGELPFQFYQNSGIANTTVLQYLLQENVSIIAVDQNFTQAVVAPGATVESAQGFGLSVPGFIMTQSIYRGYIPQLINKTKSLGFKFNNASYTFVNGSSYGLISYYNYQNGSIISFSNYLSTWPSPSDAANDIAKAAFQLFWVKSLASGSRTVTFSSIGYHSGLLGVIMSQIQLNAYSTNRFSSNATPQQEASALSKVLSHVYARAVVYASPTNSSLNGTYTYLSYNAGSPVNGSVTMPNNVIPGVTQNIGFSIFTSKRFVELPLISLTLYDQNLSSTGITPFVDNLFNYSGAQIFTSTSLSAPPGNYIAVLKNFNNTEYAAAAFSVPQLSYQLVASDVNTGIFEFRVSSGGVPLNNLPYSISVNGAYPQNGVITNGTIIYQLPHAASVFSNTAVFSISMLNGIFTYTYNAGNTVNLYGFELNTRDIILIAALGFVGLMMLVRAPLRDEFFLDVSTMAQEGSINLAFTPQDIEQVFEGVNQRYRWKYMPLDTAEVRMGIANSIKYQSAPVNLTYGNVETLLEQLAVNGKLASSGALYAPRSWLAQSNHDMEYLSAFKKLRIYCVTHAYLFSELDTSDVADMVIAKGIEKYYIVIYSKTSKFIDVQIHADAKTYLVFVNEDALYDFRQMIHGADAPPEAEMLSLYISAGRIRLADADHLGTAFS